MSDCILWTGSVNTKGYGMVWTRINGVRKTVTASRWTWEQAYGPAPVDMVVAHRCDNPPCINLDHLHLITQQENLLEMIERKRHHNQIKTHCSKHGIEYDVVWMRKGRPGRRCSKCIALQREKARSKRLATLVSTP